MRGNLPGLNEMLYEQLERLNDDDLQGDELEAQLKKTKMINDVARTIVTNSNLIYKAARYADEFGNTEAERKLLGSDRKE